MYIRNVELSEYEYEIVHILSSSNKTSDRLSRMGSNDVCAIQETPFLFDVSELKRAQQCDSDTRNAIAYLKNGRKHFDVSLLGKLKRFRKKNEFG